MQNLNIIGHIKISQIRINLIENVEKYIGACITKFLSHVVRKLNSSPIIEVPHSRHDESRRITWLLISDGKHVPLHLQHSLHCFNIHVVHPVNFLLNFLDHHSRFPLESELLIEKHLPTRIHFSILTYQKLEKATKRKVSPLLYKVSIKGTKILFDSVAAFKES